MAYFLRRESDGAGSSGPLSAIVKGKFIEYHAEPRVGYCLRVGPLCIGGRVEAYETDEITDILVKVRNYVRFSTATSIYEWWEK